MNIVKDFIPVGRRNRPGYKMRGPNYITVHSTANTSAGANARAHGKYLKGAAANVPASWHFTVDDKEIRQHLPVTEVGWHAGDGSNGTGNRESIALEICENRDGNLQRAIANAAWLVAKLLKDHGLSIDRVRQHYDWSGKNCPRVLRNKPGGWADFLAAVEAHLKPAPKLPAITRAIGLEVDGKAVKEVGYLIDNATYVRASYLIGLIGGSVTGHGDHIKIVLPAKTDPAEIAKLKAEINGLKAANAALEAKIENARIALS